MLHDNACRQGAGSGHAPGSLCLSACIAAMFGGNERASAMTVIVADNPITPLAQIVVSGRAMIPLFPQLGIGRCRELSTTHRKNSLRRGGSRWPIELSMTVRVGRSHSVNSSERRGLDRDWKPKDVARRAKLSVAAVYNCERFDRGGRMRTLLRLAKAPGPQQRRTKATPRRHWPTRRRSRSTRCDPCWRVHPAATMRSLEKLCAALGQPLRLVF